MYGQCAILWPNCYICCYNVNSWILNVHLQFSLVVQVIFVLQMYWGSTSHDIVKLCSSQKIVINAVAKTKLPSHILSLNWVCNALLHRDTMTECGLVIVSREVGVRLCLWVPDRSHIWLCRHPSSDSLTWQNLHRIDCQLRTATLVPLTSRRKSCLRADCLVSVQVTHNKARQRWDLRSKWV